MSDMNDMTFTEQPIPAAAANVPRYTIVSQVKSNRVVYFTDDPDYRPPTDDDWYYVSGYAGALPEAMTLRNCWGWRFNGGVFIDAREAPRQSAAEALLEANRKALMRILHEKIGAVRKPFLSSCAYGDVVRQAKHREACEFLAQPERPSIGASFKMLEAVAVARNCTMLEAARLVAAKAEETERVLLESERFREQMSQAIANARDEKTLLQLREWLLDKVYPELTKEFKYRIDNTEPIDLDAPVADTHRLHEIARLKVKLREAINRKREPLGSGYCGNEEIRRHKAMLAQSLLDNDGRPCDGVDYDALSIYAEARGLSLFDAARLLVGSVAEGRELLLQTEQIKDRILARIDAIKTLRDIQDLETRLEEL
ncbi:hypothetical protein [Propionivibrio dicarboxylicus]|uniref:Uncharacterized protein n=1 Tax=Propionivibrio dicarboxylicus TaxID=83767 RepID=A0A1G7YHU6_9RHOO|nr:hypothetical protein [Propionivibrio dicarboxylicus]SDG96138.1 hypothetical protein SAMN05660652_01013 [Propionivibrio dicarboxylicus]